ncbi:hypothetical protein WJX77_010842 [Trebouxia sp. C0004]
MTIKKRSGDKEHCLRLLPCLGHGSRHPHQDEQLVNDLVHSFWKMLEQFIWDAIWTRVVVKDQLYRVLACEQFVHRYCHSSRSGSTVAAVIALAAAVEQCIFWCIFCPWSSMFILPDDFWGAAWPFWLIVLSG